ncbi:MAG: undecaprenyl-phosphate alpha-N-acetylglucosaminyl 1-phosphate transferase [Planctomycetaceae bacterium]|nr:MAG: undecaprenyl-phosphate alpha-N-acetylglucosaminyl 1-phosphate transferase [Planctomycetaceae bacterium]
MSFLIVSCVMSGWLCAYSGTWLMRWLAPRIGLLDHPDPRKVHRQPIPLGGGLAILGGVVLPLVGLQVLLGLPEAWLVAWLPAELWRHKAGALSRASALWSVVGGASVLSLLGLWDDWRPRPWGPRLAIQFLVAGFLVFSGVRATLFLQEAWLSGLVSLLWMVVLVNAFNFLDNMDGLCAGLGLIVSGLLATMMLWAPGEPRVLVAGFFLLMAGSLAGFLCHNWYPARIFMGDAGSYFVGFSLAAMSLLGTYYTPESSRHHVVLSPLCVLAVPLYDFVSVVWLRWSEGRSPFQPDQRHFSHRLVKRGLHPITAVLTIHLATLTTGMGGLMLYLVPTWGTALIPLAMVGCVLLMIAVLESAPGTGA